MANCPHCSQTLPDPPERFCPNCGGDLQAVAPPPLPASYGEAPSWSEPTTAQPAGTPWDDRDRLGLVSALVETIKQVLSAPTAFFRSMPTTGGLRSPLLFAMIPSYIGVLASSFYQAVLHTIGMGPSFGSGTPVERAAVFFQGGWGSFFGAMFLGPLLIPIGLFITSGIIHLFLLLLGGDRKGFEATFRAICFSSSVSLLRVVPVCGDLVASVWAVVLYIIGIAEAHGVSKGKSAGAVLLPIVLVCCCCGLVIGLAAFGMASAFNR